MLAWRSEGGRPGEHGVDTFPTKREEPVEILPPPAVLILGMRERGPEGIERRPVFPGGAVRVACHAIRRYSATPTV